MSKLSNQGLLLRFILAQMGCIAISAVLYTVGDSAGHVSLMFAAVLFLIASQAAFSLWCYRVNVMGACLRELHPTIRSGREKWFAALSVCPLLYLGLLVYLWVNKPIPRVDLFVRKIWVSLTLLAFVFMLLPLGLSLGAHIHLGALKYWLQEPATYTVTSISDEVSTLGAIKERIRAEKVPVLPEVKEKLGNRSITSTGFVLILATVVMDNVGNQKKVDGVALKDPDSDQRFIRDMIETVELYESRRPGLKVWNPIAFLSPLSAMTGGLIALVQLMIEEKLNLKLVEQFTRVFKKLETLPPEWIVRFEKTGMFQKTRPEHLWPIDRWVLGLLT